MENDNTLFKLRKFEFEFLINELGQNDLDNVLEIGPGNFPISRFKKMSKYLGIEKNNQNQKSNIYKIDNLEKDAITDVETVVALNSIYFIKDIAKFYSELSNLKPQYFVYILPTSSWRIWTTLVAYIAYFIKKKNTEKKQVANYKNSFLDKIFLKRHGIRGNRFNEFFYYRKKYWKYIFTNLHKEYEISSKNIKIFYTGFNLFGDKISISFRNKISNLLGCSSRLYILSKKN